MDQDEWQLLVLAVLTVVVAVNYLMDEEDRRIRLLGTATIALGAVDEAGREDGF